MMKIDSRYKLHQVAGEWILMLLGEAGGEPTRVIAFNETSVELWRTFEGREFDRQDVMDYLYSHYDVEMNQARMDANLWVDTLLKYGVVQRDS